VSRVALTFDDGPSEWSEKILDLLRPHAAFATFFVVGETAGNRVDLIRRMFEEGHEVANHTWSHPVLTECDDESIEQELARTNDLLAGILGAPPARFRAPHFDVDERVEHVARGLGLTHTLATVNPPDWHEGWSAALTITFVSKQVEDGSIICLHDGIPPTERIGNRQATVDAVAALLPRLAERDLRCVTASQLLDG
jgi:peptidoglycan/xylan/chitin deacetylase (PgdA/CDA1 family)